MKGSPLPTAGLLTRLCHGLPAPGAAMNRPLADAHGVTGPEMQPPTHVDLVVDRRRCCRDLQLTHVTSSAYRPPQRRQDPLVGGQAAQPERRQPSVHKLNVLAEDREVQCVIPVLEERHCIPPEHVNRPTYTEPPLAVASAAARSAVDGDAASPPQAACGHLRGCAAPGACGRRPEVKPVAEAAQAAEIANVLQHAAAAAAKPMRSHLRRAPLRLE
eukprot:CAMPEP_0115222580 /NCGR_PEP_ID=MMETSP0270-20121206/28586_1 /TAXON_ID=71861 /ORGANISM="Scrippsiella trochoidea, Strain CCMP3099" /LENGTH=215 /DNA_ID=CAMNT_0002636771 /DNA_START=443 /DNA_END=1087 /DNA_ORIENTATION=-